MLNLGWRVPFVFVCPSLCLLSAVFAAAIAVALLYVLHSNLLFGTHA